MLDVHAPEHNIHGVRDFVVHLLTITVGLLIALALEAGVEAMHHRHQRKEAETLIRQELQSNRETIHQGTAGLKSEIEGMTKALRALEDLSQGKPGTVNAESLQFHQGFLRDSAWRTASTTGALSYMDYSEVEQFSEAYKEQDQLESMEELAINDYLQLLPILKSPGVVLDAARAKDALPYARTAMGHLSGIYFVGVGTLGSYDEALK
jgi:hypothetical protein